MFQIKINYFKLNISFNILKFFILYFSWLYSGFNKYNFKQKFQNSETNKQNKKKKLGKLFVKKKRSKIIISVRIISLF